MSNRISEFHPLNRSSVTDAIFSISMKHFQIESFDFDLIVESCKGQFILMFIAQLIS